MGLHTIYGGLHAAHYLGVVVEEALTLAAAQAANSFTEAADRDSTTRQPATQSLWREGNDRATRAHAFDPRNFNAKIGEDGRGSA